MKFEIQNTTTRIYLPFSQIRWVRLDWIYDDKMYVLTVFQDEKVSHSYTFKSQSEADRIYDRLLQSI